MSRLVLSGRNLYGTTSARGSSAAGTVFKLNTGGTGFTTLYNFSATDGFSNSDGAAPFAGLVLYSNTLYGTTFWGGSGGNGTVFAINTDGSEFRVLYTFAGGGSWQFNSWTNSGGGNPQAGLVLVGATLYGVAENGGIWGGGTLFKINTDGTGFASVHDFNDAAGEGIHPYGTLISSGDILYGTTYSGTGAHGGGTVFCINTDGTRFATLFTFSGTNGGGPEAGPILSGNTLYGVTSEGGFGYGVVFSLLMQPQLGINASGENVVLTWPTNFVGFSLQSSTNLASQTGWTTVSQAPVVLNDQIILTNPISGPQQLFFRLAQ